MTSVDIVTAREHMAEAELALVRLRARLEILRFSDARKEDFRRDMVERLRWIQNHWHVIQPEEV